MPAAEPAAEDSAVSRKTAAARYISLAPNITETLAYLGGLDRLAAVTNDCDYPEAVRTKTKIGKYTHPELEKIIILQPAAVLLESSADPRFKAKLRELKINYLEYNFAGLKNYFAEIRRMNRDLGLNAEEQIDLLEKSCPAALPGQNKTAAIIVWQNPPIAAGRDTYLSDFFAGLGYRNILTQTARYPEISPELFYQADIIINLSGRPWLFERGVRVWTPADADIYLRLAPRLLQAHAHTALALAELSGGWSESDKQARLRDYRLLRLVFALLAGAGLALCGLLYQTMLANPLAEPYLLGVSSGSAVGALGGLLFSLPPFATAVPGAALALALVYVFARRQGKIDNNGLILSGVMINAFCGALIMLSVFFAGDKVNSLMFWLMGDLGAGLWPQAGLIALALLGVSIFAVWQGGRIELLGVGDEQAEALGVSVNSLKSALLLLLSALTALIVASAGIIGFVGLIIPHIVKMLLGERLILNIFCSLLGGALFLALSDWLARAVVPEITLPVGIITAIIGVPFFVLVYKRAA
ncbi:MAG: helical backbone metal receptor [Candidatus Margulisbacteria bacterium]|jgi:iron complex transport system permease protein|nr:helical backbone metal receptor [Candidatus Margulisiibacteriota bacterium]